MQILRDLLEHGQSYWLDNLTRGMIRSGELERRVRDEGLRGVTSNPAIFHKAISSGSDYDEQIARLAESEASITETYEALVVKDIRDACDILAPVHTDSRGVDGHVSLEVSPHLLHDTEGSLAEARRLWAAVDRPNLMIKIPGTSAGVPVIEQLVYEGINVNVTLLFAVEAYEAVARAYLRALQRRVGEGEPVDAVASVASFFLSRIDVLVDALLAHRVGSPAAGLQPQTLYGRAAVASAKLAYQSYRNMLEQEAWHSLAAAGARPQRLLWASTSTKNPLYDAVRYVEPLVGRDTVNTMPEVTIEAFGASGRITVDAVEADVDEAERVFTGLEAAGIDMQAVNRQLLDEGARKFLEPFDALLAGLAERRGEVLAGRRPGTREPATTPPELGPTLSALHEQRFAVRLARGDATLWPGDAATREVISNRLGWLRGSMAADALIPELRGFADEVRAEGFTDVVLLGMGGSSLCARVARDTFAGDSAYPVLRVLDDVDPGAVAALDARLNLDRTLFVAASKSGRTVETISLTSYFRDRLAEEGVSDPGGHFVAVSDSGSPLLHEAAASGFRRSFEAPSDVGGRYSALTVFGLLPMALMGADVERIIEWAGRLEIECAASLPESAHPAVRLGTTLALCARGGRDKLVLSSSPALETFALWIEQLVAESTGKDGRGVLPVPWELPSAAPTFPPDRVFVHYGLAGEADPSVAANLDALEAAGHPVFRFELPEPESLGGEFLRWEMATATAGALLGVNPFDEPDVAAAKRATVEVLEQRSGSATPEAEPLAADGGVEVYGPDATGRPGRGGAVADVLASALEGASPGGYAALLAFFGSTPERDRLLSRLRMAVEARAGVATTSSYGPRYLHSTGQFHKGGPSGGTFLMLTADPVEDLPIPGRDYSLGALQRAQALGDLQTLHERGREVLRIHLGWFVEEGLRAVLGALGPTPS